MDNRKWLALGPSECALGHRPGEFSLYPKHPCWSSSETSASSSFILPKSACLSYDRNNSIPDHQVGNSPRLGPLSTHLAITKPPRAIPDVLIPSTNSHPSPPASLPTQYSCQKHTGHPEVISLVSKTGHQLPGIVHPVHLQKPHPLRSQARSPALVSVSPTHHSGPSLGVLFSENLLSCPMFGSAFL